MRVRVETRSINNHWRKKEACGPRPYSRCLLSVSLYTVINKVHQNTSKSCEIGSFSCSHRLSCLYCWEFKPEKHVPPALCSAGRCGNSFKWADGLASHVLVADAFGFEGLPKDLKRKNNYCVQLCRNWCGWRDLLKYSHVEAVCRL